MNVNSLFFQVVMAGLAVAIVILYIQPAFLRIGETQDAIDQYKNEHQKVAEVNNQLTKLIEKVNGISAADQRSLLIYMPNEIDNISVSRDIYNLSMAANIELTDVSYIENKKTEIVEEEAVVEEVLPVPHRFSVDISGSYDNIKGFLSMLEKSNYPLEVHHLEITPSPLGKLMAKMEIVTYSHI